MKNVDEGVAKKGVCVEVTSEIWAGRCSKFMAEWPHITCRFNAKLYSRQINFV